MQPGKTLKKIIKNKFKKDIHFCELDDRQKYAVLYCAKQKKMTAIALGQKWYDILTKKFYLEIFELNNNSLTVNKTIQEFDTFKELFNCCEEEIFDDSCFFGYEFNDDEKELFKLHNKIISNDSFIKYRITKHTFEALSSYSKMESVNASKRLIKIKSFFEENKICSYEEFISNRKKFLEKFGLIFSKRFHFIYLLNNYRNDYKNYLVEAFCKDDCGYELSFFDIYFYYGKETCEKIIDEYIGDSSEATIKGRKKYFKQVLALLENKDYKIYRTGSFVPSLQLYLLKERYIDSHDALVESRLMLFETFEKLTNYLSGDLSNIDLSKAPIDKEIIKSYKTNSNTKFPLSTDSISYAIEKKYKNNEFIVIQKWMNNNDEIVLSHEEKFIHFFDFVHYLKKDLSNSDLLMCEGLENAKDVRGINWDNVLAKSSAALLLGINQKKFDASSFKPVCFQSSERYELQTIDRYLLKRIDFDENDFGISYITDLHLLHRFEKQECKTIDDSIYVTRKIANQIVSESMKCCLIGGDISSDFSIFNSFIESLKEENIHKDFFFVLGNHELWPFEGKAINEIVNTYKQSINGRHFHLLHNSLCYYSNTDDICTIEENELNVLTPEELREKTRDAKCIIFGGIGFSGENPFFNADNGIYRNTITRREEIEESKKFYKLYLKVVNGLRDRNPIIFTHMPINDWAECTEPVNGFVYVSGHNHRNDFFDDGRKRIYADNQIGYHAKNFMMKHISTSYGYDWFADYLDGIFEITRNDYEKYYRGIGEGLYFRRDFEKLYLLKRDKTLMFLMKNHKGNMFVLNGGAIKKAPNHSLDYFYKNMINYSSSVKLFLNSFNEYQKNISKDVKKFGGDGSIHGSIVDIDFYNHLYINPLDGKITPYFASTMVHKCVYKNIGSLLKYRSPELYLNYKKEISNGALICIGNNEINQIETKDCEFVLDTDIYRISRIIKGLQYTTKYNIIRLWNDSFCSDLSSDNGKNIVSYLINPEQYLENNISSKLIPAGDLSRKEKKICNSDEKPSVEKITVYSNGPLDFCKNGKNNK